MQRNRFAQTDKRCGSMVTNLNHNVVLFIVYDIAGGYIEIKCQRGVLACEMLCNIILKWQLQFTVDFQI